MITASLALRIGLFVVSHACPIAVLMVLA